MPEYDEEALRQRVWYWLETEMGMRVDAEVELGTGRIDLVGKSPDEVWGVEVKVGNYGTQQVDRYAESDALDRLYVASGKKLDPEDNSVDGSALSQTRKRLRAGMAENWYTKEEIEEELTVALSSEEKNLKIGSRTLYEYVLPFEEIESKKTPISLEDGIRRIQNAITFSEIGIIHVPSAPLQDVMSPEIAPDPEILREASDLDRTETPEFKRREEPWVRHRLWQEYGGIPEGHIPNTMKSDLPYRPIDLIAFEGSNDPTDAVENPTENKVLGFEAKGEGSFSEKRLSEQLMQFLETSTLSELYLGVPASLENKATEFISSNPEFDQVGIMTVTTDGSVTKVRPAETTTPKHDGYLERQSDRKTGYGDKLPEDVEQSTTSPYITEEEKVRLKYTNPEPIALKLLTDDSDYVDSEGCLTPEFEVSEQPPLNDLIEAPSATRVYVLEGETVSYNEREMRHGLVELKFSYYNDQDILLLNFTRYQGGYVWFTEEELDFLQTVLHSIESIGSASVPGRGYTYTVLDEREFPDTPKKAHYSKAADREGQIELTIRSHVTDIATSADDETVVDIRLGGNKEGADLEVSKAQLVDLIASIEIVRLEENSGTTAELPKRETKSWSQARIARSGDFVEDIKGIDYRSDVIR